MRVKRCKQVTGYRMPVKLPMDAEVGTPIVCGKTTRGRKLCDEHQAYKDFMFHATPIHEIPNFQKTLDGRYVTEYSQDKKKWRWKGLGTEWGVAR